MAPRTRQNTAPGAIDPVFEGGYGLFGGDSAAENFILRRLLRVIPRRHPLPSVPRTLGLSRIQRPGVPGRMNRRSRATSGRLQRLAASRRRRRRPRLQSQVSEDRLELPALPGSPR